MEQPRLARRVPVPDEPLSRVRLRTGRDFLVIDASDSGLFLEGARLLPGTHVDVHVVTRDGRVLVRSRVVRAHVHDVRPDAITYRVALAFDRPIDTSAIGYEVPGREPLSVVEGGRSYPPSDRDFAGEVPNRLPA